MASITVILSHPDLNENDLSDLMDRIMEEVGAGDEVPLLGDIKWHVKR